MWKRGQWWAICDVCGFKFRSAHLEKRWDGLMVDKACMEPRHPQEFVRPVVETRPAWSRPQSAGYDVSPTDYIEGGYFLTYGSNGLPGDYITRTVT